MRKVGTAALTALLVVSGLAFGTPTRSEAQTPTCRSSSGPGIPAPTQVPAGLPGFHASWYGQSGYPTLCPGEKATSVVAYYNSGSLGWVQGRLGEAAYLGTWDAIPGQDKPSKIGGDGTNGSPSTGWPRFNRIAQQPAPYVAPGQVAWFTFTIQAPQTPGVYKLYLRPLVEGATWMEDYGVYWVVTVLNLDGTRPPPPPPDPIPGCREWEMELGRLMTSLPLPPELCLLPYEAQRCPTLGGCYEPAGTYCVPEPDGRCGPEPRVWTRNTVWVQPQPGRAAELHVLAHEVCHAYQDADAKKIGFRHFSSWADAVYGRYTPAGLAFHSAWQSFKNQDPTGYAAWAEDRGADYENGAEVCGSWYLPYGTHDTARYPILATWAQQWLPK